MSSSEKGDFYFGISDKKIYICFFEKGQSNFRETIDFEIPDSLNNNLNFKIILNLLKKNIKKIEKKLGFFLIDGNISIKSDTYQRFLFSTKNIFDEKKLNKEVITNILQSSIQKFNIDEQKLSIIHIIINKYFIDNKVYNFFPADIKFKKIILESELICLNKNLINKVKKLFSECNINVNKIVAYDYTKKFLDNNLDKTMCLSAHKVLSGINQSEVCLENNIPKKHGIFYKIFHFFG